MDKVDNHPSAHSLALHGPVLGIFAKEPRPGFVKTRLTPPLTPTEATALYRVALRETMSRLAAGPVRPVLCCAGRRTWFFRNFPGTMILSQGRGGLGDRLTRITAELFAAGGGPVAVAGADSPDLPLSLIAEAFAALAAADVAAIPSHDGGYALLALARPVPALFAGIPWSTAAVLATTRARAAALGLRFVSVGSWDDLDDLAGLRRLLARSPDCETARYARAHLRNHLWSGGG